MNLKNVIQKEIKKIKEKKEKEVLEKTIVTTEENSLQKSVFGEEEIVFDEEDGYTEEDLGLKFHNIRVKQEGSQSVLENAVINEDVKLKTGDIYVVVGEKIILVNDCKITPLTFIKYKKLKRINKETGDGLKEKPLPLPIYLKKSTANKITVEPTRFPNKKYDEFVTYLKKDLDGNYIPEYDESQTDSFVVKNCVKGIFLININGKYEVCFHYYSGNSYINGDNHAKMVTEENVIGVTLSNGERQLIYGGKKKKLQDVSASVEFSMKKTTYEFGGYKAHSFILDKMNMIDGEELIVEKLITPEEYNERFNERVKLILRVAGILKNKK
jgi:hypothetical protein